MVELYTPCNIVGDNMIIAGFVTKKEVFDKSISVGTYIMTFGVIMLPIVGSAEQEQDAVELVYIVIHPRF